jgi:hypothetical protein
MVIEDVHTEMAGILEDFQAGRALVDAPKHKWGIKGDRIKRIGRHSDEFTIGAFGGDNRDPCGKISKGVPEFACVEWCLGHVLDLSPNSTINLADKIAL